MQKLLVLLLAGFCLCRSAQADFNSDAEAVFNWAEKTFPTLLTPTASTLPAGDTWLIRIYAPAEIVVGINKIDNGVYYSTLAAEINRQPPIYYDSLANVLKKAQAKPDNFQSLLGKWQLQNYSWNITKQNGSKTQDLVDAKARNIIVFWDFLPDGRLLVTDEKGNSVEARWRLQVTQLDGQDISSGNLTLSGVPQLNALAASLGKTELTFDVNTEVLPSGKASMSLLIDATSIGPYKENILVYLYHKL